MLTSLTKDFIDAIKLDAGVDLSNYALSSLERRITHVFFKFNLKSIAHMRLKIQAKELSVIDVLNEITVNTTEFFRDPAVWNDLKSLFTNYLSHQNEIKIWHAGCSSGEEVYSMAILLTEMDLISRCKIIASDINEVVLNTAQRGVYHKRFLNDLYNNYEAAFNEVDLSSYYTLQNYNFILKPELSQNIQFKKMNLIGLEPFNKFDLILCRNVLIYFNKDLQNNCLKLFRETLFGNGFLMIGNSESIDFLDDMYAFNNINYHSNIFRKKPQ